LPSAVQPDPHPHRFPSGLLAGVIFATALTLTPRVQAQSATDAALPEAPTPQASVPASVPSPYAKYIDPGQPTLRLNFHDKFILGVKDAISPISVGAWVVNAGYEQGIHGKPNYGTDRGAFGERIGAAAIRDISEDIFSESMLAPLVREDPRYYIMGSGHSAMQRCTYAATRAIVTRKDDGSPTINFALIAGNFAGAELTRTYYPQSNRSFPKTMEIFAGSVGGSALGFIISEFFSSTYEKLHLKSRPQ
jgi:hypothetical protein